MPRMPKMNSLNEKVKKLLEKNHRIGVSNGVSYDYTCPSPRNYPHQWLWDSCFHAIVLTHIDPGRAKREIKTLLLKQGADGMVPCVSIWKRRFPFEEFFYVNKITQCPVIPIAAELIYERTRDKNFVREVYPKLKKFFHWLAERRDRNGNGLLEIIHPWETGIDSTPTFDKQLGIKNPHPGFAEVIFKLLMLNRKEFRFENVLMNSIYAKALKSMSHLSTAIGESSDAKNFERKYNKTLESLIKYCWSETDRIFYDLDKKGAQVKIKTISSLMPLILDDLPEKFVEDLVGHLTDKKEFWSEYPVPSVSMDEKTFSPGGGFVLWRGPTWVNTNWFISKTLLRRGYKKEARIIIDKTAEMVDKSGFWEYYNPLTGEGYGQPGYGWSALVLDMI